MSDDDDLNLLYEEFPDLISDGNLLQKEVFAHFGLLFSGYALLETGLQNCFIFSELHRCVVEKKVLCRQDWRAAYDALEAKSHASTFGTLLKLLDSCPQLAECKDELSSLKSSRDYFAHHFFREENGKMFSDEGRIRLISRMNVLRRRVKLLEEKVDDAGLSIIELIYPHLNIPGAIDQLLGKFKAEAVANPSSAYGWER